MTLYRQLFVFTLTLLMVLLAGVWVEKLQSTRSFLIDQLESHAQDTATSLGLSISPAMAEDDLPTVDTMLNAVFDRGYYRIISLRDVHGEMITERVLQVKTAGVPAWFIELIPLETPGVEALVMAGWRQAGTLFVQSHPGYAYRTLWQTAVQITLYFFILAAAVLLFGGLGLRLLLRPLKQVEQQAEAICRKEYWIQEKLPKTRELKQMVETMNRMTAKVRDMFAEQSQTAERFRKNAYSDQLTGLGNRRYLKGQVEAAQEAEQPRGHGAFLLVQVHDLQQINTEKGFTAGDELLKRVAEILRETTVMVDNVALARLTGGDFALYLPEVRPDDAQSIAGNIAKALARIAVEQISGSDNLAHVGGVTYRQSSTFAELLAQADTALRSAQQLGPNKWLVSVLEAESGDVAKGKTWWKETLDQVLDKGDILLYGQAVASADRKLTLHKELFSRIALDSGELVNAGVFIPLAERLQLVSRLDRIVLGKAMQLDRNQAGADRVAVNVSPSSLVDPAFSAWLFAVLGNLPGAAPKLVLEFAEFAAVQHLEMVRKFSQEVQQLGHGIGLDHFGQSFSNFGYLKSLRPEYVKIDRGYTKELGDAQSDSHFFISSLCSVAHSLDIQVIAEGVENEEQLALLRELRIDGLQGYLIDEPKGIGEA